MPGLAGAYQASLLAEEYDQPSGESFLESCGNVPAGVSLYLETSVESLYVLSTSDSFKQNYCEYEFVTISDMQNNLIYFPVFNVYVLRGKIINMFT